MGIGRKVREMAGRYIVGGTALVTSVMKHFACTDVLVAAKLRLTFFLRCFPSSTDDSKGLTVLFEVRALTEARSSSCRLLGRGSLDSSTSLTMSQETVQWAFSLLMLLGQDEGPPYNLTSIKAN